MKLFNQNSIAEYKERLLKSFPSYLKGDLIEVLKILPFDDLAITNGKNETFLIDNLIHNDYYSVYLDGEKLEIPYRLYFNEPGEILVKQLSNTQQNILNCIFLRHFNGFIRERRLKNLSNKEENWIVPFKIQLAGEYVYEILEVLETQINQASVQNYIKFKNENPAYFEKTHSRMVSYWNENYRIKFPKLKQYLGYRLMDKIKTSHNTR